MRGGVQAFWNCHVLCSELPSGRALCVRVQSGEGPRQLAPGPGCQLQTASCKRPELRNAHFAWESSSSRATHTRVRTRVRTLARRRRTQSRMPYVFTLMAFRSLPPPLLVIRACASRTCSATFGSSPRTAHTCRMHVQAWDMGAGMCVYGCSPPTAAAQTSSSSTFAHTSKHHMPAVHPKGDLVKVRDCTCLLVALSLVVGGAPQCPDMGVCVARACVCGFRVRLCCHLAAPALSAAPRTGLAEALLACGPAARPVEDIVGRDASVVSWHASVHLPQAPPCVPKTRHLSYPHDA